VVRVEDSYIYTLHLEVVEITLPNIS